MILHVDASCHFVSETIKELIFKKASDCSHSLPVRLSRGAVRWLHRKHNLIKAGKTVCQAQCGIISTLKLARAYSCSYIGKPSLTIYIFWGRLGFKDTVIILNIGVLSLCCAAQQTCSRQTGPEARSLTAAQAICMTWRSNLCSPQSKCLKYELSSPTFVDLASWIYRTSILMMLAETLHKEALRRIPFIIEQK